MRFELFDLQLFIHVAEANSLTKGAERSAISLPAASARIKHLEEAAGAVLLTRSPQGIGLTPAGTTLLRHARRITQQVAHMATDLVDQTRKERPRVRLMATTIALAGSLPVRLSHRWRCTTSPTVPVSGSRAVPSPPMRKSQIGPGLIRHSLSRR